MGKGRSKYPVLRGGHIAMPHNVWDSPAMRDSDAVREKVKPDLDDILSKFN